MGTKKTDKQLIMESHIILQETLECIIEFVGNCERMRKADPVVMRGIQGILKKAEAVDFDANKELLHH